jgi:hypothetical protein
MDTGRTCFWDVGHFFAAQPKSAVKKKKFLTDKDKEIHHHQPSPPATISHYTVTQMLPLTSVAVTVAVAVVKGVAVALMVAVAMAVAMVMAVVVATAVAVKRT